MGGEGRLRGVRGAWSARSQESGHKHCTPAAWPSPPRLLGLGGRAPRVVQGGRALRASAAPGPPPPPAFLLPGPHASFLLESHQNILLNGIDQTFITPRAPPSAGQARAAGFILRADLMPSSRGSCGCPTWAAGQQRWPPCSSRM